MVFYGERCCRGQKLLWSGWPEPGRTDPGKQTCCGRAAYGEFSIHRRRTASSWGDHPASFRRCAFHDDWEPATESVGRNLTGDACLRSDGATPRSYPAYRIDD